MWPWLLESSAFDTACKFVVAIVIPAISVASAGAILYCSPVPSLWYQLLRGQMLLIYQRLFRAVMGLLLLLLSGLARVFIRMRDPCGNSSNYIIRLDIVTVRVFKHLVGQLLAPWHVPFIDTLLALEFVVLISVFHAGIRNYVLRREIMRPLIKFYRTRLARKVQTLDPYPVIS